MVGHGVVSLDPERLRTLEGALSACAETMLRSAGTVADAFADVGEPDLGTVADLDEIAAWAAASRDDIVWRRAIVEDLGPPLPLPALHDADPERLLAMATHLAVRFGLLVEGDAPLPVEAVEGMLAELDRLVASDPTTAAVFFATLGSARSARLSTVIEQAYRADWTARRPTSRYDMAPPPMPEADALRLLASHQRAMDALVAASRVEGDLALDEEWIAAFTGVPADLEIEPTEEQEITTAEVLDALGDIQMGAGLARSLATAAGLGRAAVVLGAVGGAVSVGRGLVGLATAPAVLLEGDGLACDIPQAATHVAAGALGLLTAAATGPAGVVALVGSGVFAAASAALGRCGRGPARHAPGNPTRRADEGTGEPVYPGGSRESPHTDAAGVPLPHNMVG